MTDLRETAALVALLRRGDRLWHHYAQLVEASGSALAILEGRYRDPDELEAPTLFPVDHSSEFNLEAIAEEIDEWEAEGMHVVTVMDEAYPVNLRLVHNRPPILFVRGSLESSDEKSVAVVGTRRATASGLATARSLAAGLAEAGYVVVSGMAAGIDGEAHRSAIEHHARTVAVVGTGLRTTYPRQHRDLELEIAATGAVVSQFWPDAPPSKTSFPMRNIVMSGLALATVVVEASETTSGAAGQARAALKHGRRVFLHRSLLEYRWAQDCASRPGVTIIESSDDVAAHLDRLAAGEALTL